MNTEWVFRSRTLAVRALGAFSVLYSFIYVLLRVEAYALLVGAMASFCAVAAAMYITRNVDWYGSGVPAGVAAPGVNAARSEEPVRESWLD
ncbi:MAG TPA: inner membrane CreD family protein [Acidobacteriaceae bacterium]|nr:inner membrane CreD family protein [Acidobacteriaceae bacterium]